MLKIRQSQVHILNDARRRDVATELGISLQHRHPGAFQFYTRAQMTTWVLRQLDYLQQHKVDTRYAVEGLLEMFALFGERFERCADPSWALDIIEFPDYHSDKKYDLLMHEAEKVFKAMA